MADIGGSDVEGVGRLLEGDKTSEVVRALLGQPAVTSLHDTNGRWDLLAELHAPSIAELSAVLERVRTHAFPRAFAGAGSPS